MKKIYKLYILNAFIPVLIILAACSDIPADAEHAIGRTAVVRARFDKFERVLQRYKIPHDIIDYADLEQGETLKKYMSVFFPCGIGSHIETNINILARGTRLQGVFLDDDYRDIDEKIIIKNIKRFIDEGGSAFFSGYSYEFLQEAYAFFRFHEEDFPNIGISGAVNIKLHNDLTVFCHASLIRGFYPHSGWIALSSVKGGELLAEGRYKTIKGDASGPVAVRWETGKGEAVYTSYHESREAEDFKRYFAYRVSYRYLLDILKKAASRWEQDVGSAIIDSVREREIYRAYPLPLSEGRNTLYFISSGEYFQTDLYDKDFNLIISRDPRARYFSFNIDCEEDDYYILKVYPSEQGRDGVFSILVANGLRIAPYYKRITAGFAVIAVLFLLYILKRAFDSRRYSRSSGRVPDIISPGT